MFSIGFNITRSPKGKSKKPKMEFSKKILIVTAIADTIVSIFTMVMVWRTCDVTPLQYLIMAIFGCSTAGISFYYTKAKVENRIKLMKANDVPLTENSFNDNADDSGDLGGI